MFQGLVTYVNILHNKVDREKKKKKLLRPHLVQQTVKNWHKNTIY